MLIYQHQEVYLSVPSISLAEPEYKSELISIHIHRHAHVWSEVPIALRPATGKTVCYLSCGQSVAVVVLNTES